VPLDVGDVLLLSQRGVELGRLACNVEHEYRFPWPQLRR
jgi:hypothetical protein